jgi:hypothetical protein
MSVATSRLGKFARSLCRSPAGHGTARPQVQTTKPKMQKSGTSNRKILALATARVAQHSPQPRRAHATASLAVLKSP